MPGNFEDFVNEFAAFQALGLKQVPETFAKSCGPKNAIVVPVKPKEETAR